MLSVCAAGNEEIALYLLQSGAGFSSYTLMDHPDFSQRLLRLRVEETPDSTVKEVSEGPVTSHTHHTHNTFMCSCGWCLSVDRL